MRKIGIIGLGLIGGSLGLALKKYTKNNIVYGYDINQEHLQYSLENNIIDKKLQDCFIKKLDLIFIAVPVTKILKVIENIYPYLNKQQTIITDMGSTKSYIINKVKHNYPEVKFIGGHPMAGKEISGPQGATPTLYQNKNYILINNQTNHLSEEKNRLKKLLEKIQCQVCFLKAKEHDQLVAVSSHLPQIIATTLVKKYINTESNKPKISQLIGTGFLDLTRIAASHPEMWLDIFMTNKNNIIDNIDKYITVLKDFKDAVKNEEQEKINEIMLTAREKRLQLEKENKDGTEN